MAVVPFVVAVPSAFAGVGFAVTPTFPTSATVGQSGLPASLQLTNLSTPPESTGNVTVNQINLVPACGTSAYTGSGDCPPGSADPGVFQLSAFALGEGGTGCAGTTFSVSVIDPATGQVSFTPSGGPVVLTPPATTNAICRIDFTFSVLRAPIHPDGSSPPNTVHTAQIGYANGMSSVNGSPGSGSGSSGITVSRAQPGLTTTATATARVGNPISDTAALSAASPPGPAPTGTITFTLFGPNNAACTGAPVFTSIVPISSGAGNYTSPSFTPTVAGTYRWVASYSGDANNNAVSGACGAPGESTTATAAAPRPDDFDGDGKSDIAVFRPSNGTWYIHPSGGAPDITTIWGVSGDIPVAADYNGDGKADVAVFRPSNGTWYIHPSGGGADIATAWGASGDIPVVGDFNGDGKADLAVFRPSTGTWHIQYSGGGGFSTSWGVSGDIPVQGDFNGDGTADLAVFRPSNGTWYIHPSGGGADIATAWGASGDIPVPGDYNRDGQTDLAVFRPSNGTWYIHPSGGGTPTITNWGVSGDIAVLGDYSGDSAFDVAVFRPSTGKWYITPSGGGASTETLWGISGDIPAEKPPDLGS